MRARDRRVIKKYVPAMQITTSIDNYAEIETILAAAPVDVIFLSGMEKYHAGYDCLKYIRKMKVLYPDVLICMYPHRQIPGCGIRGEIDAYLSLQDPLYHWRASVLKMVDSRYRPLKKPTALSLTPVNGGY